MYTDDNIAATLNFMSRQAENDNPNIVEHIFIESGRTQYYVLNIKNNTMQHTPKKVIAMSITSVFVFFVRTNMNKIKTDIGMIDITAYFA